MTATSPASERYGLFSRLQRGAVSIPTDIAGGHERDSTRELLRFLSMSPGSIAELETRLMLAAELELADSADVGSLLVVSAELGRMLNGLQSKLRDRPPSSFPASGP